MQKDLTSIADLSRDEILRLFDLTKELKQKLKRGEPHPILAGQTLVMIFEKPSLRTHVTFQTGIQQLGGMGIYLAPADIGMGKRESVKDVALNLSRLVSGIMARTFAHSTVTGLATHATIPVINGLSDLEHPCQVLADLFTIVEHKENLEGLKLAYVGDGNNVANSLLLASATMGMHMSLACPEGYDPDEGVLQRAQEIATSTGASLEIVHDPYQGIENADILYTDVWASMGQESEQSLRMRVFQPFQVNQKLLRAAKPDAQVMHCLPAHRGEEITDEVLDGPQSIALDEAENRLHAQKAIMATLMRQDR